MTISRVEIFDKEYGISRIRNESLKLVLMLNKNDEKKLRLDKTVGLMYFMLGMIVVAFCLLAFNSVQFLITKIILYSAGAGMTFVIFMSVLRKKQNMDNHTFRMTIIFCVILALLFVFIISTQIYHLSNLKLSFLTVFIYHYLCLETIFQ